MFKRLAPLVALPLLIANLANAQEEQTNSREPSGKFWISPRVEQQPAAPEIRDGAATNESRMLGIQTDLLEAKWNSESGRLTLSSTVTGRDFLSDGNFNVPGGSGRIISVSDKAFGRGQAIDIVYPSGDRNVVMLFSN